RGSTPPRPSPSPQTSETASCTAAVPSAAVRSSPNRKSAGAAPATAAPEQSTDAPHPHTASQIAATSLSECRPPSPGSAATDERDVAAICEAVCGCGASVDCS